jgi:antitoxin FitA
MICDHVELIARPSRCLAFGHQPRPEQRCLLVEWQDVPGEQCLRSFGNRQRRSPRTAILCSTGGGRCQDSSPLLGMCSNRVYAFCVPIMIQIRNVPDALHCRLKSRAALAGMPLSDCLLSEIREVAERPSLAELRARQERRAGITPSNVFINFRRLSI